MVSKIKIGKKAISPMIATVLLIAFTVAVGGILSLWLTSLTSTQTTTTGSAAEKQVLCARSVLSIDEVDYSTTDDANVTVTYTYGTESLTNVNIYFVDSARASYNKTQTGTLSPGDTKAYAVSGSGLTGSTFQEVRIVAMCQATYPVSGECKSGQACMHLRT
jgi:flagellin-like protein